MNYKDNVKKYIKKAKSEIKDNNHLIGYSKEKIIELELINEMLNSNLYYLKSKL